MTTQTRKRSSYTEDLKQEAVSLVREQGYKISEVERSLDIGANLLGGGSVSFMKRPVVLV
jgi:transposase-like protein